MTKMLPLLLILSIVILHDGIVASQQANIPPDTPDAPDTQDTPDTLETPDTSENLTLPEDLNARVLDHADKHSDPSTGDLGAYASFGEEDFIRRLKDGEIEALYMVANSMSEVGNKKDSAMLWQQLSDSDAQHIQSKIKLGFHYEKEEDDKEKAVDLFAYAGVHGFNQDALYHAGRLYADLEKYDMALAHMRASVDEEPEPLSKGHTMTDFVKKEYTSLSNKLIKKIVAGDFTLTQMVSIYKFAHINYLPQNESEEDDLWYEGFNAVREYDEKHDVKKLKYARRKWKQLLDSVDLSNLQSTILVNALKKLDELDVPSTEL